MPSPAFVYVLYRQLESTRAVNAFLKVELRQLKYVVETTPAFNAMESALSAVGDEEASSHKKTSLEKLLQLAAASCSRAVQPQHSKTSRAIALHLFARNHQRWTMGVASASRNLSL